jgi:hypothetical protein
MIPEGVDIKMLQAVEPFDIKHLVYGSGYRHIFNTVRPEIYNGLINPAIRGAQTEISRINQL